MQKDKEQIKKEKKKLVINWKIIIPVFVVALMLPLAGFAFASYQNRLQEISTLTTRNESLDSQLVYAAESYADQLETLEIQNEAALLELNLILEKNATLTTDFNDFNNRALDYVTLKKKIAEYKDLGVDLADSEEKLTNMFSLLLDENYDEFDTNRDSANTVLDENKATKDAEIAAAKAAAAAAAKAAQPTPSPAPAPTTYNKNARNQYSWFEQKYVETEVGSFWVDIVVADLNNPNLRIITDTVDERDNCWDTGCGAKSLRDYVSANGGFAGIHGSYFCPPDYTASCSTIPYSFDLATYNSRLGKWINPYLKYKGLMTFSGRTPSFYYGQEDSILQSISVTAGIANHPPLISGGNLVYSGLDSKQANVKSYRGGIGYAGNLLYLIVARSATVPDLAYVMKALGIQNGLNLDGGGSSALYYDGYKLGPGRLLPNAIILAE